MEIDEVSEILGLFRGLRVPQHVFITDEEVREKIDGQRVFYRGLQPRSRGDTIFLARDSNFSTPIHEAVHAQTNLGELGTEVITNALLVRYRFMKNHPRLRDLARREVRYQRCPGCQEFHVAHSPQYAGRVEHYVKA